MRKEYYYSKFFFQQNINILLDIDILRLFRSIDINLNKTTFLRQVIKKYY